VTPASPPCNCNRERRPVIYTCPRPSEHSRSMVPCSLGRLRTRTEVEENSSRTTARHGRDRVAAEESRQTEAGSAHEANERRFKEHALAIGRSARAGPHHASASVAVLNFGRAFSLEIEHVGRIFQRRIQRGIGTAERRAREGSGAQGIC